MYLSINWAQISKQYYEVSFNLYKQMDNPFKQCNLFQPLKPT